MEAKVRLLESNIDQHNLRLNTVESRVLRPETSRQDVQLPIQTQDSRPGNLVVNIDEIQDTDAGHSMTDGMAVSLVDEQDCGFFGRSTGIFKTVTLVHPDLTHHPPSGSSSNIALMRHILRVVNAKRSQNLSQIAMTPASEYSTCEGGLVSSSNAFRPVSRRTSNEPHKSDANILPPDEIMQQLIGAYFRNTGLLFPYIHEREFLDSYQRFRASGFRGDVRRTWLGLLNMILAMATCTSCWEESGSETHFEESDVYYRRAQDLCQTQMLRGTTLETGK